jgi:hypothetical protein
LESFLVTEKAQKWLSVLGHTLVVIAFINFAVFWIIGVYIGGDAINGKAENGHYYVASHGRYIEVSKELWAYSKIHTESVWITHSLGILVGGSLIAYSTRKRKNKRSSAKPTIVSK